MCYESAINIENMEKAQPPSRTAEQFVVRLPDGMRDRIGEAAKANNRSMNAEIVARIEDSFKAQAEVPFEMVSELQRQRDLLLHTQSMIGLLQGKLREARVRLSADEAKELSELLKAIHEELDKPEPVEEMLDRLEGLTAEVEQIQKMLGAFGLESPDEDVPASARRQLAAMRERWAESQASMKGKPRTGT